ncbi:MAG: hypothetical protein PHW22_04200 [Bacilli bacterium]|nr:hypothetical protein [Bacilli bacterium]
MQKLSPLSLIEKDGKQYMSIYEGELTQAEMAKCMARLKIAFPSLPKEFYGLLGNRMKEKGFTDDKMRDAINYVIDNCKYPIPTISEILSYDRVVKLYSYNEVSNMVIRGQASFDDFEKREIGGKIYRVLKSDLL